MPSSLTPSQQYAHRVALVLALVWLGGCFLVGYDDTRDSRAAGQDGGAGPDGTRCGLATGCPCPEDGSGCYRNRWVTCKRGKVASSVRCSKLDDACVEGFCKAQEGCVTRPVEDGTSCDDGKFCTRNDACRDGQCRGRGQACPDDTCAERTCDERADRCVVDQLYDGANCGDGLVCYAGDCGRAEDNCTGTCTPECEASALQCVLGCRGAKSCDVVQCTAAASCDVNCAGAELCRSSCNAPNCSLDCTNSEQCEHACADGSWCATQCGGTAHCTTRCPPGATCAMECKDSSRCELVCASGAACQLNCSETSRCATRCPPENPTCSFFDCEGVLTDCGGGVRVCNRPCP